MSLKKRKRAKASKVPFVGPPIDANYVYARYSCPSCGFDQISNRGASIFCFACGAESSELDEVNTKQLMAEVRATAKIEAQCPVCKVTTETNAKVGKKFCPQCGSAIRAEDMGDDDIPDDDDLLSDEDNEDDDIDDVDVGDDLDVEDAEGENGDDEPEDVDLEDMEGEEDEDIEGGDDEAQDTAEDDEADEAEGTYTEFIGAVTEEMQVARADVRLDLFGTDENPFYNVTLAGNPVGRIHLSDQPNPDEIRDLFTSAEYVESIRDAMEKMGPLDVLKSVNASLFADKVSKSDLATRMKKEAEAELEEDYKAKILSLRDDYSEAVATVLAGMNRNFWPDVDNGIKAALYGELEAMGITAPDGIVEKVFAESGSEFFDTVLEKAQDFMSKSEEAREEIAGAIQESNPLRLSASTAIPDHEMTPENLKQRLAKGSNVIQMKQHVSGNASKEDMRKALALRG